MCQISKIRKSHSFFLIAKLSGKNIIRFNVFILWIIWLLYCWRIVIENIFLFFLLVKRLNQDIKSCYFFQTFLQLKKRKRFQWLCPLTIQKSNKVIYKMTVLNLMIFFLVIFAIKKTLYIITNRPSKKLHEFLYFMYQSITNLSTNGI
jgi:hypothetical protein